MSHDSKRTFDGMSDLDTLEEALGELGITVERNASRRGYSGKKTTHGLVAKLDRYDIGFDLRGGKIEATQDEWGVNLQRNIEGGYNGLMKRVRNEYSVATAKRQCAANKRIAGRPKRDISKDGRIQLKFRVLGR